MKDCSLPRVPDVSCTYTQMFLQHDAQRYFMPYGIHSSNARFWVGSYTTPALYRIIRAHNGSMRDHHKE